MVTNFKKSWGEYGRDSGEEKESVVKIYTRAHALLTLIIFSPWNSCPPTTELIFLSPFPTLMSFLFIYLDTVTYLLVCGPLHLIMAALMSMGSLPASITLKYMTLLLTANIKSSLRSRALWAPRPPMMECWWAWSHASSHVAVSSQI